MRTEAVEGLLTAIRGLMGATQTDDEGFVTAEWNAAYRDAADALAAVQRAPEEGDAVGTPGGLIRLVPFSGPFTLHIRQILGEDTRAQPEPTECGHLKTRRSYSDLVRLKADLTAAREALKLGHRLFHDVICQCEWCQHPAVIAALGERTP